MIYDYHLPCIVDTKNIFATFTKKKYVAKEYIPKIKRINKQRKSVKDTLKKLDLLKVEEAPPFSVIDEIITYAEAAVELDPIFERDYQISKNWKWTPFLTETKVLKFGETIRAGKSGEILMARYAAFVACFRSVRSDIAFIKQNLHYKEIRNLYDDVLFETLMKRNPVEEKLQEAIQKVIRVHVKAWVLLKKYFDRSDKYFKFLANCGERYVEIKKEGMEIALMMTKINANMLYIEMLRLQGNFEEMGKYAKTIVSQSFMLENLIKGYNFVVDPKITLILSVNQKLYKAIALWSLFFPYMAKLRADKYEDGEDINILAGGCTSFLNQISQLHKEIISIPTVKFDPIFNTVKQYFTDIMLPKSLEVSQAYSEVFHDHQYNDFHFDKLLELDYISRAAGDNVY